MQVAHALTERDVERLKSDPSPRARLATARKVSGLYRRERLSPMERRIAEDIIGVLVQDIAVEVRRALSEELKTCPLLPRRWALMLAHDLDAVAVPMLQYSEVLTDADLILIVRKAGLRKQLAIARRQRISEPLADALVESGAEEVAVTLLANGGAAISERSLHKIIDKHGHVTAVHRPLTRRQALPASVVERLVSLVSDELCQYLIVHHHLPSPLAAKIGQQARESVVLGLVPRSGPGQPELQELVAHLHGAGNLTATLLLRALCEGKVGFFEEALAHLAQLPVANVRELARDRGPLGLRALYDKAGLPASLFAAFRVAANVVLLDGANDNAPLSAADRKARIMQGLVAQYQHLGPGELEATLYKLPA